MNKKWKMVKLGEVFTRQITGEWGNESGNEENAVPVLRTTNFTNIGKIDFSNIAIRYIDIKKINDKKLFDGDIILEKSGGTENTPVGRVVFCDTEITERNYLCNNFTQAMRPDKNKVFPKFLFYNMHRIHCIGKTDLMQNKTTGIRNLQVKSYLSLQIPLPPLDEQKKIVQELDKLQSIIQMRKEQIEKMDLLVKAKFVEMFGDPVSNPMGWKLEKLKNLCSKITDGKHGGCNREENSGFYFVGAREIYNDKVNYETAPEIPETEFLKDYKRCNIENGDFIIVNTGATIGKSAILNHTLTNKTLLQKSVALLKPKSDDLLAIYLKFCYAINNKMYSVNSASAQPNLLLSQIKETSIPLPPIELQNQFADYVQKVESIKSTMHAGLEKIELLYNSRMQEYFG